MDSERCTACGIPPLAVKGLHNTENGKNPSASIPRWLAKRKPRDHKTMKRWMRSHWTLSASGTGRRNQQGRPVYPADFEELAEKLGRPLRSAGRDMRCIVSVGMLTERWDCTTVTVSSAYGKHHLARLLCEQVWVGGARSSYTDFDENGRLIGTVRRSSGGETKWCLAEPAAGAPPKEKKNHCACDAEKERFAITFPRVEGYTRMIRSRVTIDWNELTTCGLIQQILRGKGSEGNLTQAMRGTLQKGLETKLA